VPTVSSLGLGVKELAITKLTLEGTATSIALNYGLNSMSLALLSSANMDIV
jgi:hypothetical protein